MSGFNSRTGHLSQYFPRSTQPGHSFVGSRYKYQPKGGDALRLESKGRYGSCVVADKTVTYGSHLSALEIEHYKALYEFTFFTFLQYIFTP